MNPNNRLVVYAFVMLASVAAAFMPWGAFQAKIDLLNVESTALPVTANAFSGHVNFANLLIPNWFSTLLVVSGSLLGMLNSKKVTAFSNSVLIVPFVVAIVHCLLVFFLLASWHSVFGMGLLLTLVAAGSGAAMSSQTVGEAIWRIVVVGQSRLWLTLISFHLAALTLLCYAWLIASSPVSPLFCVIFVLIAAMVEVVAFGLHKRQHWARIAAMVMSVILLCPPLSPLGIFGLWGLLAPGSRAEFSTDN